jgi:hypothetical protein
MPNNPLARIPAADLLLPQRPAGGALQHTQAKLQAMGCVVGMAVYEMDSTFGKVEAYVTQPGRSVSHQRWLEDNTATLVGFYTQGVRNVVAGTVQNIIDSRPPEPASRPAPYIEEPKRSLIPRIF